MPSFDAMEGSAPCSSSSFVIAGLVLGAAGSLLLTGYLETLLYGVSATDPLTFVVVSVLLGAVGLLASYVPSRRAARVDPTVTLRAE